MNGKMIALIITNNQNKSSYIYVNIALFIIFQSIFIQCTLSSTIPNEFIANKEGNQIVELDASNFVKEVNGKYNMLIYFYNSESIQYLPIEEIEKIAIAQKNGKDDMTTTFLQQSKSAFSEIANYSATKYIENAGNIRFATFNLDDNDSGDEHSIDNIVLNNYQHELSPISNKETTKSKKRKTKRRNNEPLYKQFNYPTVVFFAAKKQDKHCLLPPKFTHNSILHKEFDFPTINDTSINTDQILENIIQFLHVSCEYCFPFTTSGKVLPQAQKILQYLLQLYSVNEGDSCTKIDASTLIHENENNIIADTVLPNKFFLEYVAKSKPVVITGAMKNWRALSKWSNKYLRKRYTQNQVKVKLSPNGNFEGCENATLWDGEPLPEAVKNLLQSPDKVVVRPATKQMDFGSFLDMLEIDETNNNEQENTETENDEINEIPNFYLEYCSIPQQMPEMMSDLPYFPNVAHSSLLPKHVTNKNTIPFASFFKLEHLNLWLGNGKTVGKLHFDPFDNLLCQISGQKRVTLFAPTPINNPLYEGHIREGILSFDSKTNKFSRTELAESTSMVMSPIDIRKERESIQQYPNYEKVKENKMVCEIGPGEILFLPSFWWHEVDSKISHYEHRNLAINYWFSPFYNKEFPCSNCPLYVNQREYHSML